MPNESVKPAEALSDLIGLFIGLYESEDEPDLPNATLLKHVQILLTEVKRSTKSEAEKDSRNAKLVHENDELMAENEKCKAAYDKCATGGNSLASVIIGWDLPKGWQDWTYVQANDFLHNLYGINSNMAYERYEIWLCWKSIREAGQALEELKHE